MQQNNSNKFDKNDNDNQLRAGMIQSDKKE